MKDDFDEAVRNIRRLQNKQLFNFDDDTAKAGVSIPWKVWRQIKLIVAAYLDEHRDE